MHRLLRLVLAMAVLWCGLHLSPAEADGGVWTAADAGAHARSADHGRDGDARDDVVHGCHNHCPVSPEPGRNPKISGPDTSRTMLFALPAWPLTPSAQAPPIEPPAA